MSDQPRYWLEFLKHPRNQLVAAGVAGVSVLLSFPWGGDALILGGLALAAIEVLGLAVVPGLPSFQQAVNSRSRVAAREDRRKRLLREIDIHGGSRYLSPYQTMWNRVQSLYRTAGDASTRLSPAEVEQLDDLTVNYLTLCLSDAVMSSSSNEQLLEGVRKKLAAVERRLANAEPGSDQEQADLKLKAEYEDVLERGSRLSTRRATLDAALVGMPVRFEEVYQMVMTAPNAGNLAEMLEESVSRLQLTEKAAMDISMSTSDLAIALSQAVTSQEPGAEKSKASRRAARQAVANAAGRREHPGGR